MFNLAAFYEMIRQLSVNICNKIRTTENTKQNRKPRSGDTHLHGFCYQKEEEKYSGEALVPHANLYST